MESLSLFDILVGQFVSQSTDPDDVDPSYFDKLSEEEKIRQSIIENLKMVLGTRRGSVVHLPDFGIPDVLQVYFDHKSTEPIKKMIQETIVKYEPRIGKVRIKDEPVLDEENMRISLKIIITMKENPRNEVLLTEFSSTGWTKVIFERDMK